jgi:hypothetical protein
MEMDSVNKTGWLPRDRHDQLVIGMALDRYLLDPEVLFACQDR